MPTPLGAKIYEARRRQKLTLEQLAERTESSKSYIWSLENGPAVRPSAEKIAKVAGVLQVSVDYLLNNEKTTQASSDVDEVFFRRVGQLDDTQRAALNKFLKMIEEDD
jgi:transcriptional regulator with XRE-family HTH domain